MRIFKALVVDDEPAVRMLTIRELSRNGFTCDGAKFLRRLEIFDDIFHVRLRNRRSEWLRRAAKLYVWSKLHPDAKVARAASASTDLS